jgi:hypothetical protein
MMDFNVGLLNKKMKEIKEAMFKDQIAEKRIR